tara:strand:- start:3 stop:1280 length:1278 start_codon:yes stop_codon:yes gene_type:complete
MEIRYLENLSEDQREIIIKRKRRNGQIQEKVRSIIEEIKRTGDEGLKKYTLEFDGIKIKEIDITEKGREAYEKIDEELKVAIKSAADNIREFHELQVRKDWVKEFDGREMGQRFRPINRIGAYVPGGTAAYPSSALMTIIPAKVAGVKHISVVTPPSKNMNQVTLAAAYIAGADRIYAAGGAQGIAALAHGTETIEKVDKIVGPGNQWVAAAKIEVRKEVEIDFVAGVSEILIIADETADARFIAADLIAQAEHDPNVAALVITEDVSIANRILFEIEKQMKNVERNDIIRKSIDQQYSGVIVASNIETMTNFVNEYAPEHLSIQTKMDELILDKIDSAGSIFMGKYTPVAAGDYASGANHILPTNQNARCTGGLSVDTFIRATTVQKFDKDSLKKISKTITTIARSEGLHNHAGSIDVRFDQTN